MISWAQGHLFLYLLSRGWGGFRSKLDTGIREACHLPKEWAGTTCQELLMTELARR